MSQRGACFSWVESPSWTVKLCCQDPGRHSTRGRMRPLHPSDRVPPSGWAPGKRRKLGRFPGLRNCPHKREFGHLI